MTDKTTLEDAADHIAHAREAATEEFRPSSPIHDHLLNALRSAVKVADGPTNSSTRVWDAQDTADHLHAAIATAEGQDKPRYSPRERSLFAKPDP